MVPFAKFSNSKKTPKGPFHNIVLIHVTSLKVLMILVLRQDLASHLGYYYIHYLRLSIICKASAATTSTGVYLNPFSWLNAKFLVLSLVCHLRK
jgi:hypothetical protein